MHFTLLAAFLALSLRVSCARIQARQNTSPPTPLPPSDAQPATAPSKEMQVFNPVDMGQLCQNPAYYCIYVDQVRAGIVHASPVNATDNQGAFLFERSAYKDHPFHVCFGSTCVDLDFKSYPGCVTMHYVFRQADPEGHLLARFADNVDRILGPREDMVKTMRACGKDGQPLPYAVIGARVGGGKKKQDADENADAERGVGVSRTQKNSGSEKGKSKGDGQKDQDPSPALSNGEPGQAASLLQDPAAAAPAQPKKMPHDYFDDVTVPLADA